MTNTDTASISASVTSSVPTESYGNVNRLSFYFVSGKSDDSSPEKIRQVAKRYNYLLDLSPLFKRFIVARAEKDSKFKNLIQKVEKTTNHPILDSNANGNVAKEKTAASEVRRRKTEKEEDAELLGSNADTDDQSGIIEFTDSPSYIQGKLRDYQVQGLNWMVSLHESNLSGILADEMGLGKTLQTISFLGYLRFFKKTVGPHLVIVPKSTLENWQREFSKWIPQFHTLILTGDKTQRASIIANQIMKCDFDVVISSYELIIKEQVALKKFHWNYIVIDEAHRIKNEDSLLSQVIRLFISDNRLLITGTPLQNNLHELWALLNYILPDVFGDSESFDEYFGKSGEHSDAVHQQEVIKQLHTILSPFLLRRIKSQVEKSLLPKKELNLYVSLSPLQRQLYRSLLEKDMDAINGMNGKKESKTRLLNIVMQLRKCCNHPYLFDGVEPGPPYTTDEHLVDSSQKLKTLDKLLKKCKAQGSRVLIFSQMSRMLDIMEDYCYLRNYEYCRIDGSTDHESRIEQIDAYNEENSSKFIFLLTTRAGGLGINLTSADVVVLYDSDWNPQADLQAMDRAHRIGQKKQVKVFRMITDNSIEEKVLERAMKKLRLDQVVIQQARAAPATSNQVGKDELLDMIRHGAQEVFDSGSGSSKDEKVNEDFDLDVLLNKSEEKTKELNSKYSQLGFDELQDLGAGNTSAYQWNGQDFKKQSTQKVGSGFMYLNPGKRERKENYNIDSYYRGALKSGSKASSTEPKAPKAPKVPKQIQLYDHQFFPQQLSFLLAKESNWYKKQVGYKVPANQKPSSQVPKQWTAEDTSLQNQLEQLEIDNAEPLTEEEEQQKEKLLASGYSNWTRREFQQFIQASAKHGRTNIDAISQDIMNNKVVNNTKSKDDIEEYAKVFWKRFTEIDGFEKFIHQIKQGEERIAKIIKQKRSLHKKMAQYEYPLREMQLRFPPTAQTFNPEEDAFLLVQLFKYGIDSDKLYENIHKEALKSTAFKFDYFLKSRTTTELNRRCNALIASVVKEIELEEEELKKAIQRKRILAQEAKNRKNYKGKAKAKNGKGKATKNGGKISKNGSKGGKTGPKNGGKAAKNGNKKTVRKTATKRTNSGKGSRKSITSYFE